MMEIETDIGGYFLFPEPQTGLHFSDEYSVGLLIRTRRAAQP